MAKRLFDLLIASIAIVALLPIMLIVLLAVWLDVGWPPVFSQARPGLSGRPFQLLKFRTMREAVGPDGQQLPDRDRLTRFGGWLRATSLDELPELINIIRGEMSLVGPRPLLMEYLTLYSPEQARRHAVRPGLTGWAQVNGRNALTWEARFKMDVWYVDHQSLLLDLRILGRTLLTVLRREGIAQPNQATMERFRGTGG